MAQHTSLTPYIVPPDLEAQLDKLAQGMRVTCGCMMRDVEGMPNHCDVCKGSGTISPYASVREWVLAQGCGHSSTAGAPPLL